MFLNFLVTKYPYLNYFIYYKISECMDEDPKDLCKALKKAGDCETDGAKCMKTCKMCPEERGIIQRSGFYSVRLSI